MSASQPDLVAAKHAAARQALEYVEDGMAVGIGSGTTAAMFIGLLGERVRSGLRVRGSATSDESASLARAAGVPLLDMSEGPDVDVDIDGADEIDGNLDLLKGNGGALLHEKLVALSSRSVVIIADDSKLVARLGRRAVPVEVVPFYWSATHRRICDYGVGAHLRGDGDRPFVTDSGNYILDVDMSETTSAVEFARLLKAVPGVVEHGIFLGIANTVLVGSPDGTVRTLTRTV